MSTRTWGLFAVVALLWGSSFLLVKLALDDVSPGTIAFVRALLGALVLLPIVLARDALRGLRAAVLPLVLLAIVDVAGPFVLISGGEQFISSSLAGILVAADPIFVALLALRFDPAARSHGVQRVGLLLGILGVAVLLGVDVRGNLEELAGAAMVLLAAFCFAIAALTYTRWFSEAEPIGVAFGMLAVAAVLLAPVALLSLPPELPSARAGGALAVLGLASTGIGFWLFYVLIARAGAASASLITYAMPAVATVLGVVLLDEPFGIHTAIGLALILGGSLLGSGTRLPAASRLWRRRAATANR